MTQFFKRPLQAVALFSMLVASGAASAADYFAHSGAIQCVGQSADGQNGLITLQRYTDGCDARGMACFQVKISANDEGEMSSVTLPVLCEQNNGGMVCTGSLFGAVAFGMVFNQDSKFNAATIFAPENEPADDDVSRVTGDCFI